MDYDSLEFVIWELISVLNLNVSEMENSNNIMQIVVTVIQFIELENAGNLIICVVDGEKRETRDSVVEVLESSSLIAKMLSYQQRLLV